MKASEPIPIYRDGRHYDAMNRDMVADIPFYLEEAKRAAGPVLELACGTGRLTIPIAQSGISIEGVDRSPSMLAHLRTKAGKAGVKIPLTEADIRDFDLGRKFSLILIGFNSIQHLHDYASQAALFANVRKHLSPGGTFVFDVFNPKIAFLAQSGETRKLEREYEDPDGQGKIAVEQTLVYEDATQVSHIRWFFSLSNKNKKEEKDFRVEELHLRCFFPQELDLLVRSQGFEIVKKFGNFERKPFASGDMKQVVICR
jgi:SAM-dependent methyltransferase